MALQSVTEQANELTHQAGEYMREKAMRGSEITHRALRQVKGAREELGQRARKLGHDARIQLDSAMDATTHLVEEHPFLLIALSVGAGMGTSLLLPRSGSRGV